jgi:G patch domain-containing protein 1
MANRFQSSKSSTVNTAAQSQSGGITDPSQLPTNQNQQPSQTTANTTVDLSISREIKPWQPHRMLCKRFNIAPPAVSVPVVTTDGSSSTVPGPSQVEDYLGPTVMKQLITDHQQSSLIKQQQQTIDPHMETLVKEEAAEQQNATERQHKHEERDGSIVALPSNPDQIAEDNRLQRLISLGGVTAIAEERIKAHESDTIGERPTMDIFRALFAADDDEEVESEQDQKNVSADATVPTTQTEMVVNLEQPSDFKRPLLVSPPSNSSSDGEWVEKRRSPSVVHSEQSSRSSRSRHRHHRHRRHRQRDSKRDRQDKDGEPKQQHKKHKRRHRSQSSSGRRERSHRKRSKSRERHHDSSDKQRRKERDERSRHRQDNNPNDRRRRHGDFPAQQPASGNDNKQQRERPSAIDFF